MFVLFCSNQELLDDIRSLEAYVLDASSLNCRKLVLSTEVRPRSHHIHPYTSRNPSRSRPRPPSVQASSLTKFRITPDRRALGRRFGKTAPDVFKALEKLDAKEVSSTKPVHAASQPVYMFFVLVCRSRPSWRV